ncbi:ABC1 family-domain-containing protein [Pilobolus umbonatus]|nr:ABC1 family-domain-containing protein [Pilobolus umbonatus]
MLLPLNRVTRSRLLGFNTRRLIHTVISTKKALPPRKVLYAGSTSLMAAGLGLTFHDELNDQAHHYGILLQRISIAAKVGVAVAVDYKITLSRTYTSIEEKQAAKQKCDLRSANRVLDGFLKLGGIYVKIGQHVSAMSYILPVEWTSTLSVLQDQCEPSSPEDIKHMFLTDYGSTIDETFEEFDWTPLGVASLAQVHKARLKKTHDDRDDDWVAVKFQHPRLEEFCLIDLQTVSFIIQSIKRVFPDFGFDWIMQEMKESLPLELDFEREAANAAKVKENFAAEYARKKTPLVIPGVVWAKKRILCMEFIKGGRIDDAEYLKEHNIDPSQVSAEITKIFSKMMFLDGFLHCDPHPGNMLIRPSKSPQQSNFNFEVVLLDHGLYRTLDDTLRKDYAHLWVSLLKGDEEGIREYSLRIGCRPDSHRLFASLLTGREWSIISTADLSSNRADTELNRVTEKAKDFIGRIYDILQTLPRIVLILLKTGDLLRGIDETLMQRDGKYMTYAIMGKFCAKAVWLDMRSNLMNLIYNSTTTTMKWKWMKDLICVWWEYRLIQCSLWMYQLKAQWQ